MAKKIFSGVMKVVMALGSVLGGFLAVTAMLNTLIYCPLNNAIAAEVTKRETVDAQIKSDIKEVTDDFSTKIDLIVCNQSAVNEKILTKLTEQSTDIKWIKQNLTKR